MLVWVWSLVLEGPLVLFPGVQWRLCATSHGLHPARFPVVGWSPALWRAGVSGSRSARPRTDRMSCRWRRPAAPTSKWRRRADTVWSPTGQVRIRLPQYKTQWSPPEFLLSECCGQLSEFPVWTVPSILQDAPTRLCAASSWLWTGRLSRTRVSCPAAPALRCRRSAPAHPASCSPRTPYSGVQMEAGRLSAPGTRPPTRPWWVLSVCVCVWPEAVSRVFQPQAWWKNKEMFVIFEINFVKKTFFFHYSVVLLYSSFNYFWGAILQRRLLRSLNQIFKIRFRFFFYVLLFVI